ncbi:MAG: DUF3556 domain-containing protein [Acidimicrobiales bacterium]
MERVHDLGVVFLFLAHPGVELATLSQPWWILVLTAALIGLVVYGNLVPARVSFLLSMRYYAGNWAATVWCFRGDSLERLDRRVTKATMLPHQQLERVYGSAEEAAIPLFMGYAFRGFHTHGRALWALVPRACGPDHEDYLVLDGELVAGTVLGWNFGDGPPRRTTHRRVATALRLPTRRCARRDSRVAAVSPGNPAVPADRRRDRVDRDRTRERRRHDRAPTDRRRPAAAPRPGRPANMSRPT